MDISKQINFFDIGKFTIKYSELEHNTTDNPIQIYSDYKISLHLTDGLFGVLPDKIVGGEKCDILLFAPNEIHFGRFAIQGVHRFIHIYLPVDFYDNISMHYPMLKNLFTADYPNRVNCLKGFAEDKIKIISCGEKIAKLLIENNDYNDIKLISETLNLLILSAELYTRKKSDSPLYGEPPVVRQAMDYILEHYEEKITLADIAQYTGCSTVYLSKTFKKYTGKTVYQYITEYRISKATLLLKSGCSVTDACYRVGFGDCSNFIRTFTKIKGITPFKYRQNSK